MDGEPITTPPPVGPESLLEPDFEKPVFPMLRVARFWADTVRVPARWIREKIEANRGPKYYWYHKRFKKAVPIDECYLDDVACAYEANVEYRRNFDVDKATLDLLRHRRDACNFWQITTKKKNFPSERCQDITDIYNREEINYFTKYGDLPIAATVQFAYNKQKHRMIMERRRALLAQENKLPEGQTG